MKKLLSLLIVTSLLLQILPSTVFAASIPSGWAVQELEQAKASGIVTDNVTKDYTAAVTREEFCELVVVLYEKLTASTASSSGNYFTDTNNPEVIKAYNLGIVYGVSATEFAPKRTISRQEICAMLVRCIDKAIADADVTVYRNVDFADIGSISDWALPSVRYAFTNGIMQGVGGNRIDPLGIATCEQSILLAYRIYKNYYTIAMDEADDKESLHISINDGFFISIPDVNRIAEDSATGLMFIDNELIIHAVPGTSKTRIEGLLDSNGAKIVGEISATGSYQIRFPHSDTYLGLQRKLRVLEESSLVSWGSLNLAFEAGVDNYYPEDPKWKNLWEKPGGLNWGVKAINAPGAWEYKNLMKPVKVGVIDCCFIDHEDLTFYSKSVGSTQATCKESGGLKAHGTHVSGTIAAGFDNDKGISGVAPNGNLYGIQPPNMPNGSGITGFDNYDFLFYEQLMFAFLIDTNKCKVINHSRGYNNEIPYAASRGNGKAVAQLKAISDPMGQYLKTLLDNKNDFVIVASAGNSNSSDTWFIKDNEARYGYRKVDRNKDKDFEKWEYGNVDTVYNSHINYITEKEVKDRIIVVGSCFVSSPYEEEDVIIYIINAGTTARETRIISQETYSYSAFSSIGSRVDVVAPGQNIYSTVEGNSYSSQYINKDGASITWDGTSHAAPHVSGIAAMLFGLDDTLTGKKVKEIIIETATTDVNNTDKNMVNAKDAIERVLGIEGQENNRTEFYAVNRYELFDISMTWHDAKAYCERIGGKLATIKTKEEQLIIENLLRQSGQKLVYWIGLTDEHSTGRWTWVTGDVLGYSNWAGHMPVSAPGYPAHYVAVANYDESLVRYGRWVNISNDGGNGNLDIFGFICER